MKISFSSTFFLLFSYRQPFFQRVCAQEVTMFQNSSNKKGQYPKPYQSVRDNFVHYSKSLSYTSLLCVFGQFSVFRSSCLISLVHSFISLFQYSNFSEKIIDDSMLLIVSVRHDRIDQILLLGKCCLEIVKTTRCSHFDFFFLQTFG